MAAGRVVAAGTMAGIVGDTTVIQVDSEDWADAFAAIEAAGLRAALIGRSLRVPGAARREVEEALGDLQAQVSETTATLEERFFELTIAAHSR
jgi:ABC-2 type transport system ATP-binding protein/ribosome-dependent ATPase